MTTRTTSTTITTLSSFALQLCCLLHVLAFVLYTVHQQQHQHVATPHIFHHDARGWQDGRHEVSQYCMWDPRKKGSPLFGKRPAGKNVRWCRVRVCTVCRDRGCGQASTNSETQTQDSGQCHNFMLSHNMMTQYKQRIKFC